MTTGTGEEGKSWKIWEGRGERREGKDREVLGKDENAGNFWEDGLGILDEDEEGIMERGMGRWRRAGKGGKYREFLGRGVQEFCMRGELWNEGEE